MSQKKTKNISSDIQIPWLLRKVSRLYR